MGFSLVPDYSFGGLGDIETSFFTDRGISLVLLDLDNTIAPYDESEPSELMRGWMSGLISAGVTPFIVSNSRRKTRVDEFAAALGIGFVKAAGKPSPSAVLAAAEKLGRRPEETALIGDQIYTDALAANRAGMTSVVLRPIKFTNIFLYLRYLAEKPFRALCRNRMAGG